MQRNTLKTNERWLRAQKEEREQRAPGVRRLSRAEKAELVMRYQAAHLEDLPDKASVCLDNLKGMRVLEIGGVLYVDRVLAGVQTKLKIALDPVIELWEKASEDCEYIRGTGEYVPLTRDSVDLCWCLNTIDHTAYPLAVLQEIRRVLGSHGHLVISCNVFPIWARPLFPLFNKFDAPHPHHFTESSFIKLILSSGFNIEASFSPQKTKGRNWKTLLGKVFGVRVVEFRCTANTRIDL